MSNEWMAAAVSRLGGNQAELARRLSERLGRPYDRSMVNKMVLGKRFVRAAELLAIADITGEPLPGFLVVPLISRVSAGQLLDPAMQISVENAETVIYHGVGSGDFFALEVEGDSMDRLSPPGSRIVVDRSDRILVDGKAYVFMTRDGASYKLWRARPPRLEPYSTNPDHQPIFLTEEDEARVLGRVRESILPL